MEGSDQEHRSWQAGPLLFPCPSPSPASISAPSWTGGNFRPSAPSNSEMGQAGSCYSLLIPSGRQTTISFSCSHLAVAALLLPLGQGHSTIHIVFLLTHTLKCAALNFTTWPYIHLSLASLSSCSLSLSLSSFSLGQWLQLLNNLLLPWANYFSPHFSSFLLPDFPVSLWDLK